MIWAAACFLLWIAYGVVQARRNETIRVKVSSMSRGARAGLGAVLMVGGAAILMCAGLVMEATGTLTKAGITPAGWLIVAAAGLAFVHAQTMSLAMLVSLAYDTVTNQPRPPSDQQTTEGTNDDKASPDLP